MIRFSFFLGCALVAHAAPAFELQEGDRVAFLGDAFLEREQYEGWIELAVTTRFADRSVTFRNLGWSGDLPNGASRCGLSLLQAGNEPPEEGWRQLQNQLKTYQPNVLVTGYGMAASLPGGPTPEEFRRDFERLLDEAKGMRVLVLGAPPRIAMPGDEEDQVGAHRARLAGIDAVLKEVAEKRGLRYVSLQPLADESGISDNGIHLNSAGYRAVARLLEKSLGWPAGKWDEGDAAAALRRAVLRKNEWFFHRSRPANMAYIFGFRKAEQGRNAGEILAFEKLVADEEGRIAAMRGLSRVLPEPELRTASEVAAKTPQPQPQFTVAEGFEVTLWAENPLLFKPTQMNFDERGRLWVASSETYPQVEVGQTADDKVLVLEDRDGDGRAETSIAFATGLLMPTGLLPADGGCYVAQSTDLLHFRDTDGDGKADVKRRVLSGFGTEDTHHNLHTLRRAPDGKIWMNQSIYTRTDTETPHGVMRLKSGGIMRFDPRANRVETEFFGWCNPWGHQFDRYGQSFVTDGAGSSGINWGLPGAMYFTYAGGDRLLAGISPGSYPKFCGLEIIESPTFPADWQGNMITCDFRAHRVVRFTVTESGAGYAAQETGNLLRTDSVHFRPIDVKVGPDGALYIADWANPIINHGEVDFRDPRRDREHGRIWRVQWKGGATAKPRDLAAAGDAELMEMLVADDRYARDQALAVLAGRARSEEYLAAAKAWMDAATGGRRLLAALWLGESLGLRRAELLEKAFSDPEGPVRAAAVRIGRDWLAGEHRERVAALMVKAVADEHPRVRLEAVRALTKLRDPLAADAAFRALAMEKDGFLDYALWLNVRETGELWISGLLDGRIPPEGREAVLGYVLGNLPRNGGVEGLRRLMPRPLPADGSGPWFGLAVTLGDHEMGGAVETQLMDGGFEPAGAEVALRTLEKLVGEKGYRFNRPADALAVHLAPTRPEVAAAACRLAGTLQAEALLDEIAALANSTASPAALRLAAYDGLSRYAAAGAREALLQAVKGETRATGKRAAALSLVRHFRSDAVAALRGVLPLVVTADDAKEFWRQVLSFSGLGEDLAKSFAAEPLTAEAARLHLPAVPDIDEHAALVRVLREQAGMAGGDGVTGDLIHRLADAAGKTGDAARGEMIYRQPALACVACHAIGGAGGKVGPDMTSIGASAPLDYLVESVLLPGAKVKEGYHSVIFETRDGRTVMGRVVRKSGSNIVIMDAADQEVVVPEETIAKTTDTGSLMPAGLIQSLDAQQQADLFKFLGSLGKPGDFDATRSRAPRVWGLLPLAGAPPAGVEKGEASLPWTAVIGTVNGRLLASDAAPYLGGAAEAYAAARIELAAPAEMVLTLPAEVTAAWIDGEPVRGGKAAVAAGRHVIVVRYRTGGDLRIESSAGTFLPQW
jgi:putative heme-binding domain-containing protein